jgi:antitoxin ParD1/3/4
MVKIATFAKPETVSKHNHTQKTFKNKFANDALLVYIYTTKQNIMKRQSISFTEPNDEWLKSQIDNKEYSSKSELVNDLIRQARNQQKQIDLIRLKLDRAEKSGFTTDSKSEILKQSKSMLNA